jgi:anti-anti-sigma regulatory factor
MAFLLVKIRGKWGCFLENDPYFSLKIRSEFMKNSITVRSFSLPVRIDEAAAVVLKSTLIKLINEGARKIICNFSATTFLAEEGAEELVNVARFLAKVGGELGICQIKPEIKMAIQKQHLFKFYSVEESVAVVVLKNLVAHFEEYEDIFDIKVRMEKAVAHVEIYLGFDEQQTMGQVQQTVDLISHSLEKEIKEVKVLIVPSCQFGGNVSFHPVEQKKQIIFSSQGQAAWQLAQGIQQTIPRELPCIPIKEVYLAHKLDLVAVVFTLVHGTADVETTLYLKELRHQKLALFAVTDAYPHSGYAGECMKNISALLDASNTIVGKFVCQTKEGQVAEEIF